MKKLIRVNEAKGVYLDPATVLLVLPAEDGFASILTSQGGKVDTDMTCEAIVELVNTTLTDNFNESKANKG